MRDNGEVSGDVGQTWRARRQTLSKKLAERLPAFIQAIETTEASCIIAPRILPYKQVDPAQLIQIFQDEYKLRFETPEDIQEAFRLGVNPAKLDVLEQLKFLLNRDRPTVEFENGRFPVGPSNFVPITRLVFSGEMILAGVVGHTAVAELLVSESFEALWKAAGASKRWEDEDVQHNIEMRSYGSATKVDLGFDPMQFLAPGVREYLEETIVNGEDPLGAAMGRRSAYDAFAPSKEVVCSLSLDELDFNVRTFNKRTGRSDELTVRFSVRTRDEAGRGVLTVITELPIDEHVRFVHGLVEAVADGKQTKGQTYRAVNRKTAPRR